MSGAQARRPLPRGWRWARLGEVCERNIQLRNPLKTPDDRFAYVDISSVDSVTKRVVLPQTMEGKSAPSRARQVLRANDVLVATTRPNLNSVCIVPPGLDGQICSTGFCVLRAKPSMIEPTYVYCFVQAPPFVGAVSSLVRGALYPAVTDSQVFDLRLPVAPVDEQRRIAARLSEQMAQVERMRQAAMEQAASARTLSLTVLSRILDCAKAARWQELSVADVCDFLAARSIKTEGNVRVLAVTTACLSEVGFLDQGVKEARMDRRDAIDARLQPGEILIARSNTPELVGRVSRYAGNLPGVVASDLTIRLLPREGVATGEFLALYLAALYSTGYWRERAGGASGSMKKITRRQVAQVKVPVPPEPEQRRISNRIAEQIGHARKVREAVATQLEAINALPGALLEEVFGGFEPPDGIGP